MRGEGIVPVMEVGNNNGNSGFGGYGNGDWAWIIVLFLIFGWGRNGFGNGFGGGNDNSIPYFQSLDTDFATLERKLDGVNNGLCDGFYAMAQQFSNTNQNIANSTASLQQTLCQGFSGINQNIVTNGYETRLGIQSLSSQLANCCCDIEKGIMGVNYNLSQLGCGITNAINNSTRDLIDNQNANYRALHDEIVANRIEDKNAQITAQQNEINALRLKASQEAQNAYLLSELKPCPQPSYVVNGPTPVNFPTNCCNTFSGFNSCGNY